jgi:hypothetical protein
LSKNTDPSYFARQNGGSEGGTAQPAFEIIAQQGPRTENSAIGPTNTTGLLGSRIIMGLQTTLNLQNSNQLFTTLGGTQSIDFGDGSHVYKTINTVIRLTGFKTGYRVEVPLKLLKA